MEETETRWLAERDRTWYIGLDFINATDAGRGGIKTLNSPFSRGFYQPFTARTESQTMTTCNNPLRNTTLGRHHTKVLSKIPGRFSIVCGITGASAVRLKASICYAVTKARADRRTVLEA